ncbi:uncharacterized protein LOC131145950 isoform X2 [Malania oleifera]|uniref:uncharacterized protein LOC131145950 isoform X2 n=1 Tax=Malania oleifera TaxID=397392 RepID=UPI0025ADA682|nr:uncharacterized protein LOC131145950 isoform X2 [Malania oleifera]
MAQAIDFSQTQRVVLLIDLHPLLHLQNPSSFLKTLISSVQTLLSFPPLSSSLFSFRLFFSSLSPLRSFSKLHPFFRNSAYSSLSFHHPPHTLSSLTHILNSLSALPDPENSPNSPSASLAASSLLQLVHDYAWDPPIHDPLGKNSPIVRSNLVILFSPIARSLKCLSEFMNVDLGDELLSNVDVFCKKFRECYGAVSEAFVSRDIHCSWVDVKYELEYDEGKVGINESVVKLGYFESGIKSLGWGFCSTESIVLGSSLVPFGLIYPKIGMLPNFFDGGDGCKAIHAQLTLEISDVNGNPLECKCCDLDLINPKTLNGHEYDLVLHNKDAINLETSGYEQKNTFWGQFDHGVTSINVRAVQKHSTFIKIEGCFSDVILLHGSSLKIGKERNEISANFFADRVLEMLLKETSQFMQRKAIPIWPIFLSFMHREGYWALVSFSNGNENSCTGILKPFTVYSALIYIIDNGILPPNMTDCLGGQHAIRFTKETNQVCMPNINMGSSNEFFHSQSGTSSLERSVALEDGKQKKVKKHLHLPKDLTWNAFCKEAIEHSEMVLEDVYFARGCNNSKKLKFLKCWIKQIKKSDSLCRPTPDGVQPHLDISEEIEEQLNKLHQESGQPVSSSISAGEDLLTRTSGMPEGTAFLARTENPEAFFSSLSVKIQHGFESEGVDLRALAERLVHSSIRFLYQKRTIYSNLENQSPVAESDDISNWIVPEVTRLLLVDPKDLTAKHKCNDSSILASDPKSTVLTSVNIVREYELQILFRMEILQSEIAVGIQESMKLKFVRQICLLLEKIQCHLEGGFFGDASLDNYVERTIKSSLILEDTWLLWFVYRCCSLSKIFSHP